MHLSRKLTAVTALVTAVSTAWATSPHFISATGTVNADGSLAVNFKEAGLGDSVLVHYTLTTDASASYTCFNKGSNAPQGQPYQVPDQTLTASGDFQSGRNGNITATLEAGPPSPAPADAVLKCTSTGKTLCLTLVSYSGTTLSDDTNGPTIGVTPDPTSRSFSGPTKKSPAPPNCITG
jgi:hypothetical protein